MVTRKNPRQLTFAIAFVDARRPRGQPTSVQFKSKISHANDGTVHALNAPVSLQTLPAILRKRRPEE